MSEHVEIVVIPGAGSSGLTWHRVREHLPVRIIAVPDARSVAEMAEVVLTEQPDLREPRPRVLVGASLGAMVAVELARSIRPQGLVLAATGPGIEVSPRVLDWTAHDEGALAKIARLSLVSDAAELVEIAEADLRSRGQKVLARHLRCLSEYVFVPPPPTPVPPVVLWGTGDRSVPREDHVELARRIDGVVAPLHDAGHLPFHERPREVAGLIARVAERAGKRSPN